MKTIIGLFNMMKFMWFATLLAPGIAMSQISANDEILLINKLNAICTDSSITFVHSSDDFTLEVVVNDQMKIPQEYYAEHISPLLDMEELSMYGLVMVRMRFIGGKSFYQIK